MTPPITAAYDTVNFSEVALSTVELNAVSESIITLVGTEDLFSSTPPTFTLVPEVVIPLDEVSEAIQASTETGLNIDDYSVSAEGMWDYVFFQARWSWTFADVWNGDDVFKGDPQPPLPSG